MKICKTCRVPQPMSEFYSDARLSREAVRRTCKKCCRALWAHKNAPPAVRAARRRAKGLTAVPYRTKAEILEAAAVKRAQHQAAVEARRLARLAKAQEPKPWRGRGSKAWYAAATPAQVEAYRLAAAAKSRRHYDRAKAAGRTKPAKACPPAQARPIEQLGDEMAMPVSRAADAQGAGHSGAQP
jgi:hypothetical protein